VNKVAEQSSSPRSSRIGLISFLVVFVVSILGFVLDYMLLKEGLPRYDLLLLTNGMTGLIAGGLFYQGARHDLIKREFMRQRMKTVADLNHYIRNALQVIKFCNGRSIAAQEQLQLIREAADRIEWALSEVVPLRAAGTQAAFRKTASHSD
jgi:hypothetical protein